jgi:4-hydroxy-tetrahydrodipicolinate synthase
MKGPRFPGTGVALVTPFLDSGEIDFAALTRIVEHLTRGDVDYLVVLGTTGESATLSPKEKQQVFAHVAAVNAGRRPLVAGIGGNDTRSVVQDLQAFRPQGYDAVLSVSPYYNKPAQEGICRHYRAVAEACPLPLILYNVPGRTGMNMSAETTLRIARDSPNVIGIKEASGNLDQVMRILRDKPDGFEVISGDDAITLPLIALGATGVISVIGNAYPKTFSDMVRR